MSPGAKTGILVVVAIAVIVGIVLYVHFTGVTLNGTTTSQGPKEYRGSAILAAPPATFPNVFVPQSQDPQKLSYYANGQSAGDNYVTAQNLTDLAAFYKQGFAALGWKVTADSETPAQVFMSALQSSSTEKMANLTLIKMPDGLVQVNLVIQQ